MPMVLEYGNIAHGLVWAHFIGFVHPVLPGKHNIYCILHPKFQTHLSAV